MDQSMYNYTPQANVHNQQLCEEFAYGCIDQAYLEFDELANTQETGACLTLIIPGCIDVNAENYNPQANEDNGTCTHIIPGCTDPLFAEYNSEANTDDGSCITAAVFGCTDQGYLEYWVHDTLIIDGSVLFSLFEVEDENINTDDGSCATALVYGCYYSDFIEYNALTCLLYTSDAADE